MRIVCDNPHHDAGEGVCVFCSTQRVLDAASKECARWVDGFEKHGLKTHPGLSPEQNAAEIASRLDSANVEVKRQRDGWSEEITARVTLQMKYEGLEAEVERLKAQEQVMVDNALTACGVAHKQGLEDANLQNDALRKLLSEVADIFELTTRGDIDGLLRARIQEALKDTVNRDGDSFVFKCHEKPPEHIGGEGYAGVPIKTSIVHDKHCCASIGCHRVCSHLCGTELEAKCCKPRDTEKRKDLCGVWVREMGPCVAEKPCEVHAQKDNPWTPNKTL